MTDYPILFSAPMVRALLDGRKTMTRRLSWRKAKPKEFMSKGDRLEYEYVDGQAVAVGECFKPTIWQRVKPGDRLYVRETFCQLYDSDSGGKPTGALKTYYRASSPKIMQYAPECEEVTEIKWRPSIHMPRWASRLTLAINATRIERLQDISTQDCWSEGIDGDGDADRCPICNYTPKDSAVSMDHHLCKGQGPRSPVLLFSDLWDSLHGKGAWEENPELVVLSFGVHECNIDQMDKGA